MQYFFLCLNSPIPTCIFFSLNGRCENFRKLIQFIDGKLNEWKSQWTKIQNSIRIFWVKNNNNELFPERIKRRINSPVNVVLVSLLVDQLSGLFLIFFGRPKKNLSSIRSFLFTLLNFLSSLFQKMRSWPKKWEIDRTIGRPRDWPKPHGRDWSQKQFMVC